LATPIKMPKFGMTMTEGTLVEWCFGIDDVVDKGAVLLIIESEKAEIEVEATASGILRHIWVEPGETVPCGSLLAALAEATDEEFDADAFHAEHHTPEESAPAPAAVTAPVQSAAPKTATGPTRKAVAPAARALAKKLELDTDRIPGTGPGGRVTKADVQAWVNARKALVTVADGVALEAPTLGEGEPVLLLPGFGTDISAFALQIPELAKSYCVTGINPRGVGMSDASEVEEYDPALLAADALGVAAGPTHVIGASMGAAVALEMATANPESVRSLTLITPAGEASPRLQAILAAWCELAARLPPPSLALALLPWLFGDETLADEKVRKRIARGLAETLARAPATVLPRYATGLSNWSERRGMDFSGIETPTLVLVGGEDLLTRGAARIADSMPNARTVVVPNVGHALGLEAPEIVNREILAHIAAASERAS
jgi:pyruvate dehydrogenase E2 component (dihydrolipoamide acetyltransferase)